MVKILNIALYIVFILIPALYFIWLLKHEHLIFKTFVVIMAILSTIGILLKFNFKPYNHIFTMFILVCQFLTMYIYSLFICVYLYRFSFKFVKRRPYRFGNIVATMIAITLTISGFYSHYNKKEVVYHVTVPKTSSISQMKICLVSDLHLSSGTYMRQVRKLVKTVNDKHTDKTSRDHYDISQVIKGMDTSLPTITLDHNPERFDQHTYFTDLQLSGHTHNGQIFPGNIILHYYYQNSYGLSHYKNHYLLVSGGYGSWGFPFRLGTQCEYDTIYLTMRK